MKKTDVEAGINAIHSAIDFIANATDSDETGIGEEMLSDLHKLSECLKKDNEKLFDRSVNARVRHIIKKRSISTPNN